MTKRLTPSEAAQVLAGAQPIAQGAGPRSIARPLEGAGTEGEPICIPIDRATLVVFLSVTCDACAELAELVRDGVDGFAVVGALREAPPVGATFGVARDHGTWLIGDGAFDALRVSSAPFFVILDEHGSVVVEGVAFGRAHVERHCGDAAAGHPRPDMVRLEPDAG